ncbi:hypothetical protein TSUD_57020 [Trifolium subterraneum]|uniref:F-box/kelch-repeat protein n=1 Tax=Trifolium subterraneum TaxID=3900 RepID=A0A2Z6NMP4_TRISU|nr:hypothetical protein TSUD_57020 [Trifolium subterraneum]
MNGQIMELWFKGEIGSRLLLCTGSKPHKKKSCKLVHGLPLHIIRRKGMGFEALENKLFLLGGCGWSEDATNKVYSYNASSNSWIEVASLSTAR